MRWFLIIVIIGCSQEEDMRLYQSSLGKVNKEVITKADLSVLINATSDGGTLNLTNKIVYMGHRAYVISKNITLYGGEFIRESTPTAITINDINIGDNVIEVDDASVFSPSDFIEVVFGTATTENARILGSKNIASISGNIITLTASNTAQKFVPAGNTMIWSYVMFDLTEGKIITFDNCIFDGNKTGNNYTWDWVLNRLMQVYDGHTVINCTIKESPCESFITSQGSKVNYNTFLNINGSAVHYSNSLDAIVQSEFIGNYGDGICQIPFRDANLKLINGHNEGVITFSNKAQWIKIEDNNFKNGLEGCYGVQTLDDFNINVQNNTWENFKSKLAGLSTGHPDPVDTNLDTFINVPNGT